MKNIFYSFIIIVSIIFLSCSKPDTPVVPPNPPPVIQSALVKTIRSTNNYDLNTSIDSFSYDSQKRLNFHSLSWLCCMNKILLKANLS